MFQTVALIWWGAGVLICTLIAVNGGTQAWFGTAICAILFLLTIFDWGTSDDPNDWSV